MICVSVSYKRTGAELRQQFSFSEDQTKAFLKYLIDKKIISGGVIVSTCNRSELYVTARQDNYGKIGFFYADEGKSLRRIEEAFSEFKDISRSMIRKNCLFYQGIDAVRHLFKVVSGMDSMVLGEDEILHQVKEAYQLSQGIGAVDVEINLLFQGAFNCAKLTKSKTRIKEMPTSVGTLTANYIEDYLPKGRKVLVIGATGQIGSIVAKDLIDKNISVIGTSRRHNKGNEIIESEKITWIDYHKRYDYINDVAVIVSATKSPHYTITLDEYIKSKNSSDDVLIVDLSVPYDIDRDIEDLENVSLLGIDYVKNLAKNNNDIKISEAVKVNEIISECVEDVLKKLYIRNFKSLIGSNEDWFEKMIIYLKETLDSSTFLRVLEKVYVEENGG